MTTPKVDDYYSSLKTSESQSSVETKTGPIIKKKLKLKVKPVAKPLEDVSEQDTPKNVSQSDTTTDPEVTIHKPEKKKPTYEVIRSKEPEAPKYKERSTSSQDTKDDASSSSTEKQPVKFKAGFGKSSGKIAPTKKEAEEKRRKLSPHHKSQKHRGGYSDDDGFVRSNKIKHKKKEEKRVEDHKQNLVDRTGETIMVPDILSLKEFSEKLGVALPKLIAEFMKNGIMVNMNSPIDFDTASIISEAFDIKLIRDTSAGVSIDEVVAGDITEFLKEDDSSLLIPRAPVISIMGHVDHGKTSLLDYIRKEKVADGEAGGITQTIGAYQVEHGDQKITFLDTPGHEAFTVMRSRGAKSTDIAILVVAADEGVKPQTIESISHAKEAGIPVIVAINKMDKEGANPDFIKGQLAEKGLTPEDWGGDTPMVPVSALTGFGIDDLLEIILLSAEILDLRANPDRRAVGTVLESHLDTQLGAVASVLINTGTIHKGDNIVCSDSYGKVKVLKDYTSKGVKFAGPGMPVLIVGLDRVVSGGDILQVTTSIERAREKAIAFKEVLQNQKIKKSSQIDMLMMKIQSGNLQQLKVVVKADTNGSLEAVKNSLLSLSTEDTTVSIIYSGVGNITEGDIHMCQGSEALLIGFGVEVVPTARNILQDSKVEYINSRIIYHITDKVEKIVTGMYNPKEIEVTLGTPKVGAIFFTSNKYMILGLVLGADQTIENKALVRVIRKDKVVGKGEIISLKQGVEEVKSLEGPIECGIKFKGDTIVEDKDILEVYKIEIEKR